MSAVERTTEPKSLDEAKAVYGEKWPGFFNNFSTRFPALNKGSVADERGCLETAGAMDLPFSAFFRPESYIYYSQKYLEQTPRAFFETIDRIAKELGITQVQIRNLKELQANAGSLELRLQYFDELDELIAPVYFRLREMGYGHFDLTG